MTIEQTSTGITIEGGVIAGPLRSSVNNAITSKGSIHDDETASKLGFRGGTVAGSIHMELFPPLLLEAFGKEWFERGTLSLYFVNATTDREPVRAFLRQPAAKQDTQVDAWVLREDGMRVAEGTASVGDPGEPTALLRKPLDRFEVGDLRILKNVTAGQEFTPVTVQVSPAAQAGRMPIITEKLDWYESNSLWGGAVATPATMVQLLYAQSVGTLRAGLGPAVGLFGAIELRNINGPVMVGQDYEVTGHVVAIGQ
ncbi:MAG: hypothetical protein ACRDHF_18465, partial [Tepidiformaceae bacterium]